MNAIVREIATQHSPEWLVDRLAGLPGIVLLRTGSFDVPQTRYSFVASSPFMTFRSFGSRCEITPQDISARTGQPGMVERQVHFGNPWRLLDSLIARFELLDQMDVPFPLGGCFGFWGYELRNFVEARLLRRAVNDLELPDCQVGFYDSLVAFDHRIGKTWIISTGTCSDGTRSETLARERFEFWRALLEDANATTERFPNAHQTLVRADSSGDFAVPRSCSGGPRVRSNVTRAQFLEQVRQAQQFIRSGDIYQVNLSHRLTADTGCSGWELFQQLAAVSPAPFGAYLDCGGFQIASSSPEQFLQLSGSQIRTRPIKGTRPRSADALRDAQLAFELQTSPKEMAELVMITDLLRNDLGRVCEFGSIQVPDLARLERFAQVQHLVSTIEGGLREDVTHFGALASCFPGGSITGAPKIRAMEIIDELEPIARGPYTGALGYLGFNRESQLSIVIRSAICQPGRAHFNVGAGIVADSDPEAEFEETITKARGFLEALGSGLPAELSSSPHPRKN